MDWGKELKFADKEITEASVRYAKSKEGFTFREIVLAQQGFEIGACWYKKHNGVYEGIAKLQAKEIVALKNTLSKEQDEVARLLDLIPDIDKERQVKLSKEKILQKHLNKHNVNILSEVQFCLNAIFDAMDEYRNL